MIKNKQITLIIHSFTPSDINFQTFMLPKVILAKKISQKFTHLDYSLEVYFGNNNVPEKPTKLIVSCQILDF